MGEFDEVAGDVHHAIVFIHHHHAARAHDGAELHEGFVVHRGIEHFLGDAAAGRTAGLHGLDLAAGGAAFADVIDESLERSAEGHFDEAGIGHLADQGEDLGAGALGAAGLAEPGGSLGDDRRHVEPGFDVVDVGGLAPESLLGGERGAGARAAGKTFEGGDERGFLAADERPGAFHKLDIELEAAAHDVVAEEAGLARLVDGAGEAVDGERILGAHIDDALGGAGDIAANQHAFEQRVGIAFDFIAVHVGAGIAFVGVADHEFAVGGGPAEELPFEAGEEAGAAAAAQLGGLDLLDDKLRIGVDQDLVEGLVTADGNVLFDIVGVNEAAVAQHDFLLRLEERNGVPGRDFGETLAVVDARGEVVPLLDFAEGQIFGDEAGGEVVEDAVHVARLHAAQDHQRGPGQADVDQRLLRAETEAAHRGEGDIAPLLADGFGKGMEDPFGAIAGAAGAHADADTRARRQEFGHAGFADGVEGADVLDAGEGSVHAFCPFRKSSSSRWRMRSFMWPKMA